MPALKCPNCGYSDLRAVDVELLEPDEASETGFRVSHRQELGCTRCDWSPSKAAETARVLVTTPAERKR